jgi:co-chaperonin GroES (HSP10)
MSDTNNGAIIDATVTRLTEKAVKQEAAETIPGGPNVAPQGDLVLLKRVPQEKTKGGILVPEIAQEQMMSMIVEVGPGRVTDHGVHIPPRFHAGQYVLVSGHASAYKIDRDHVLVHDKDIIGVWREGPRDS